jgi:hypothetical protein
VLRIGAPKSTFQTRREPCDGFHEGQLACLCACFLSLGPCSGLDSAHFRRPQEPGNVPVTGQGPSSKHEQPSSKDQGYGSRPGFSRPQGRAIAQRSEDSCGKKERFSTREPCASSASAARDEICAGVVREKRRTAVTQLQFQKQVGKILILRAQVGFLKSILKKAGVPLKQFDNNWVVFQNPGLNRIAKRYQNARYNLAMAATKLVKV